MANVNQFVEWKAGEGSAPKYSMSVNGTVDVVSQTATTLTVRFRATIAVTNHPNDSRNSWAASDFAVLTAGDKAPGDYSFTGGQSYYQAGLPIVPNAPQSYVDAVIAEFRGDTWASGGPNAVSLYIKDRGLVLDKYTVDQTQSYIIDITYSVPLTGDPNQPVLIWQSSGANNSTDYNWLTKQTWVSLVDLDYRPGKVWNGSTWLSHNRSGGAANIRGGSSNWISMRTYGGDGTTGGEAPYIRNNRNAWANMRKIGQE